LVWLCVNSMGGWKFIRLTSLWSIPFHTKVILKTQAGHIVTNRISTFSLPRNIFHSLTNVSTTALVKLTHLTGARVCIRIQILGRLFWISLICDQISFRMNTRKQNHLCRNHALAWCNYLMIWILKDFILPKGTSPPP
jgi:hypothetical protein